MKKTILGLACLLAMMFVYIGCDDNDEMPLLHKRYPRLTLGSVSDISSEGATFHAEFLYRGDFEILRYGFVWSTTPDPTLMSDRVVYAENLQELTFSHRVFATLIANRKYWARAFVETEAHVVYSPNMEFVSLGSQGPKIHDFFPKEGQLGDTLTVLGEQFSYVLQQNQAFLHETPLRILEGTDSTLKCVVPGTLKATSALLSVSVQGNKATHPVPFKVLPLSITGLSSEVGYAGDTVRLYAQNFDRLPELVNVFLGTAKVEPIAMSDRHIDVVIAPGVAYFSQIKLQVAEQSATVPFAYYPPRLLSASPEMVTWRDTLRLSLANVNLDRFTPRLYLNDVYYAGNVVRATDTELTVVIPDDMRFSNPGRGNKVQIKLEVAGYTLVQNEWLRFKAPRMLSVSANRVAIGDRIVVEVENFHPSNNQVRVENVWGRQVVAQSLSVSHANRLEFNLSLPPNGLESGTAFTIQLLPGGQNGFSGTAPLSVITPVITAVSPSDITDINMPFTVTGSYLNYAASLTYNGAAVQILSRSDTQLVARMSEGVITFPGVSQTTYTQLKAHYYGHTSWGPFMRFSYIGPWNLQNDLDRFRPSGILRTGYHIWTDGRYAYLLGGKRHNTHLYDFFQYEPSSGRWVGMGDLYHGDNENILLGFFADRWQHAFSDQRGWQRYDDDWFEFRGNVPAGVYSRVVNVDGTLLVINNARVFQIDPVAGNIHERQPVSPTGSLVQDRDDPVYAFDGKLRYRNLMNRHEYEYNPETNGVADLGEVSTAFFVQQLGTRYFAVDGTSEALYEYFPATRTYAPLTSMPWPGLRFRFALGNKLYFGTASGETVSYELP